MTNKYLLTAAGFSKSFGGLLCKELTSKYFNLLIKNKDLQQEILQFSDLNNFENILSRIRKTTDDKGKIETIENTLVKVLKEMTESMSIKKQHNYPHNTVPSPNISLDKFLKHFDQVFTLNQDTFIEEQNLIGNGLSILGIKAPKLAPESKNIESQLNNSSKYYIKLHGSYNWKHEDNSLMIFGSSNDKVEYIESNPLFEKYHQFFLESLCKGESKLVIIGYSFCDPHINNIINKGIKSGLEVFIWNPSTLELLESSACIPDLKKSMRGYLLDEFSLIGNNKNTIINFLKGV